jgi:hypothetical protein
MRPLKRWLMPKEKKLKTIFTLPITLLVLIMSGMTSNLGDFNSTIKESSKDSSLSITNLPFGCSAYYNPNYPPEMVHPEFLKNDSKETEKSFREKKSKCSKVFWKFKDTQATNLVNKNTNTEYFLFSKEGNNYVYSGLFNPSNLNDSLLKLTDSIRFRLPNFGNHRVYLSFNFDLYKRVKNWKEKYKNQRLTGLNQCDGSGNLILYNSEKEIIKVINLYRVVSSYESSCYRYFFIKDYQNIFVYNISGYPYGLISVDKVSLKHNSSNNSVKVVQTEVFSNH